MEQFLANQYSDEMPWSPEDIEERRRLVVKGRVRGSTYVKIQTEIVARFGRSVGITMLNADFRHEMARRAKEENEDLDEIRRTMLERLDKIIEANLDRAEAGSIDHQEMILKAEARRARLIGADAPTRQETTVRDITLTPEQLLGKMAEISARIAERRKRAGLPEHVLEHPPQSEFQKK